MYFCELILYCSLFGEFDNLVKLLHFSGSLEILERCYSFIFVKCDQQTTVYRFIFFYSHSENIILSQYSNNFQLLNSIVWWFLSVFSIFPTIFTIINIPQSNINDFLISDLIKSYCKQWHLYILNGSLNTKVQLFQIRDVGSWQNVCFNAHR